MLLTFYFCLGDNPDAEDTNNASGDEATEEDEEPEDEQEPDDEPGN